MKDIVFSEVKLAILLKEFCDRCSDKGVCNMEGKCRVVEFAEFIMEESFVEKYLIM